MQFRVQQKSRRQYESAGDRERVFRHGSPDGLLALLLVPILAKPLLALMRRYLMSFAFATAWHR